jgi:exosome complex component RRP42
VPLLKIPIPVTVFKLSGRFFVDPTSEEEQDYDARLTVTTIEDGTICALQKGGDSPITIDDVEKMISIALKKAQEIRKSL